MKGASFLVNARKHQQSATFHILSILMLISLSSSFSLRLSFPFPFSFLAFHLSCLLCTDLLHTDMIYMWIRAQFFTHYPSECENICICLWKPVAVCSPQYTMPLVSENYRISNETFDWLQCKYFVHMLLTESFHTGTNHFFSLVSFGGCCYLPVLCSCHIFPLISSVSLKSYPIETDSRCEWHSTKCRDVTTFTKVKHI